MDNKDISKLGDNKFNKQYDRLSYKYLAVLALGLIGIGLIVFCISRINNNDGLFFGIGSIFFAFMLWWAAVFVKDTDKLRLERNIYMLNLARQDEKEKK